MESVLKNKWNTTVLQQKTLSTKRPSLCGVEPLQISPGEQHLQLHSQAPPSCCGVQANPQPQSVGLSWALHGTAWAAQWLHSALWAVSKLHAWSLIEIWVLACFCVACHVLLCHHRAWPSLWGGVARGAPRPACREPSISLCSRLLSASFYTDFQPNLLCLMFCLHANQCHFTCSRVFWKLVYILVTLVRPWHGSTLPASCEGWGVAGSAMLCCGWDHSTGVKNSCGLCWFQSVTSHHCLYIEML